MNDRVVHAAAARQPIDLLAKLARVDKLHHLLKALPGLLADLPHDDDGRHEQDDGHEEYGDRGGKRR
jgi:hypothetical protein